jgi:hypothetical protein
MKRLGASVFHFDENQLWGPSSARNAEDRRYSSPDAWNQVAANLRRLGARWIDDIMPASSKPAKERAFRDLKSWFQGLALTHLKSARVLTPRYMLQTLGTEWGRNFSKNLWVDYAGRVAFKLLGGGFRYDRAQGVIADDGAPLPGWVVVTDGRFANEILAVKRAAGMALRVVSSNQSAAAQSAGVAGHVSETSLKGIPEHWWDLKFINDKTRGLAHSEKIVGHMMKAMPMLWFVWGDDTDYNNYPHSTGVAGTGTPARDWPDGKADS